MFLYDSFVEWGNLERRGSGGHCPRGLGRVFPYGKPGRCQPLQGPSPFSALFLRGPCSHICWDHVVTFPDRQLHPTLVTLHGLCPCSTVRQTSNLEQRDPGGLKHWCSTGACAPLGTQTLWKWVWDRCRWARASSWGMMYGCVIPCPFWHWGPLFYQCLPLMRLFSMSCPSPSLLNAYKVFGAPHLCQAPPQPHIPSLSRGTSHAFGSVWQV